MRHSQLEFDFSTSVAVDNPPCAGRSAHRRQRRGQMAYLSGLAAEEAVERHYARSGYLCLHRRWRGPGGEVDLIFRHADDVVFVEVKAARSHDVAAERVSRRQAARIGLSAETFVAAQPPGTVSGMRVDVALVDGTGRVAVLENAFAGWL